MSKKKRLRRTKATGKRQLTRSEEEFQKLASKLKPKDIRYGKRIRRAGKYVIPVLSRSGKTLALLPWRQTIKRDLRVALELYHQKTTVKTRKALGINLPGWKLVRGGYDPVTREAVWSKRVYKTDSPVPIGTPDISRRSKSFGYLGKAIEALGPYRLIRLIDKLPKSLLRVGGSVVGLKFELVLMNTDEEVTYTFFETRIDLYVIGSKRLFVETLVADALMQVCHYYGYAGQAALIGAHLMVGGRL